MRANPELNPYELRVGMKICIPRMEGDETEETASVKKKQYNTQEGDTLSRILDRFQITYGALCTNNPDIDLTGSLENLTLNIPENDEFRTCPSPKAYIVKDGDNINSIAKKMLTVPDKLLMANPTLAVEDFTVPGTKVCTPD
jgi:LysM repeat protein